MTRAGRAGTRFVLLLTERLLIDPHAAYETFKDSLSDDFCPCWNGC
jgi:hypothetical protein